MDWSDAIWFLLALQAACLEEVTPVQNFRPTGVTNETNYSAMLVAKGVTANTLTTS